MDIVKPKHFLEFERRFAQEPYCRNYLATLLPVQNRACPACGATNPWQTKRNLLGCRNCRQQFGWLEGTVFKGARSLVNWFRLLWVLASEKQGLSVRQLQHKLGMRRYAAVWKMLKRLQPLLSAPPHLLQGQVLVEKCHLAKYLPWLTQKPGPRPYLIAALEISDSKITQIALSLVPDLGNATLEDWVQGHIQKSAAVTTDEWAGFGRLARLGYTHRKLPGHSAGQKIAFLQIAEILKELEAWITLKKQRKMPAHTAQQYLDAFCFYWNYRTLAPGETFALLLEKCLTLRRI